MNKERLTLGAQYLFLATNHDQVVYILDSKLSCASLNKNPKKSSNSDADCTLEFKKPSKTIQK